MKFGITLAACTQGLPPSRAVELAKRAEANGFEPRLDVRLPRPVAGPVSPPHVDGAGTERLRLGTCVTNPATRDITVTASALATLNGLTGGRADLGIGRGDSARRVMGKKPTTVAYMEECCRIVRYADRRRGDHARWHRGPDGVGRHGPVPIWVAGYGPIALAAAGRVADGVILQLADADIIRWCIGFVRAAAEEAGRDPDAIEIMAAAPAFVSDDLADARNRVRWFPALVSNHVVDLINKYSKDDLPEALWKYVENREGYDYHHHAEVGSDNAVRDRFDHRPVRDRRNGGGASRATRRAPDAGVNQFNIYLMNGDEEEQLDPTGRSSSAIGPDVPGRRPRAPRPARR